MNEIGSRVRLRLARTPVQTFILCPLAVAAFEAVLHGGRLTIVPWGASLLAWGYLQYRLVGRYRLPLAGGSAGMAVPPERIITTGPYRYTRNPMYLGHLIFLAGLALDMLDQVLGEQKSFDVGRPAGGEIDQQRDPLAFVEGVRGVGV